MLAFLLVALLSYVRGECSNNVSGGYCNGPFPEGEQRAMEYITKYFGFDFGV
jgi:hypothetical protein